MLILIMFVFVVSCSKDSTNDNDAVLKGAVATGQSNPISDGGTIPYIIPGANRGGNRTCAEVATYFSTPETPVLFDLCDWKRNYGDYNFDGENEWDGVFPYGLNVTVEGNFVSFLAEECFLIGEKFYKVGAVIVKGSNSANVYFYPEGTLNDAGLAAPNGNRMVSNLTFCFIECEEQPNLVVALKSYMTTDWAVTGGGPEWGYFIGYKDFIAGGSYPLYLNGELSSPAGVLEVGNFDADPLLEVRITSTNGMYFVDAYLFVGTVEYFNGAYHDFFNRSYIQ
jgi:hypothetical protein